VTGIAIRHLRGMPEFETAVSFQEETWGKGFSERVPRSLMKVTQRLGGVVAGAFDAQGRMVGFVYGMTGVESGRLVHWSDILAVSPEVRNDGVGRRLKAFQREAVLPLGVTRMYWTFDPLESRNAYLNLGRLGAVAREYAPDMYGVSDSPLHRGLGTDRFVATWELDSPRVEARLAGEPGPTLDQVAHLPEAFPVVGGGDSGELPRPDPPAADVLDRGQEAGGLRVPIPLQIQELRDRNPELAAQWRGATRAVLHSATQCGWEVRELVRAPNLSYYVVVPD
jgi:predicted GNAT superfamily acetyltransferase